MRSGERPSSHHLRLSPWRKVPQEKPPQLSPRDRAGCPRIVPTGLPTSDCLAPASTGRALWVRPAKSPAQWTYWILGTEELDQSRPKPPGTLVFPCHLYCATRRRQEGMAWPPASCQHDQESWKRKTTGCGFPWTSGPSETLTLGHQALLRMWGFRDQLINLCVCMHVWCWRARVNMCDCV